MLFWPFAPRGSKVISDNGTFRGVCVQTKVLFWRADVNKETLEGYRAAILSPCHLRSGAIKIFGHFPFFWAALFTTNLFHGAQ
jgi:hypothetical protein